MALITLDGIRFKGLGIAVIFFLICLFVIGPFFPCKDICVINAQSNSSLSWAYMLGDKIYTDKEISNLKSRISKYNVIAVTGFRLNSSGKLNVHVNRDIKKFFNRMFPISNTILYPIITFSSTDQGRKLLISENSRKRAVIEIFKLITQSKFLGLHLDFEYIKPSYINYLAMFLKELKEKLQGIKLTMAVFPQVDFPFKHRGFHDLKVIGKYLDEVVIMCYDYHNPGTEAGPVTDIKWAEDNIEAVLKYLRPSQVWLGVPAYGYIWSSKEKTKAISARTGSSLSKIYGGERHPSGNVYIKISRKGLQKEIFFSDKTTRSLLAEIARKYNLNGTAFWRIGFEED